MRRIKMKDVAKAVGVSAMTVSRALRADGRIAPDTRRKVLEAVRRLGYVPDRTAASFSTRRSGFVGVLVPSLNNVHFAETAAGLQNVLHPEGRQLLLGHTNYDKHLAERLVETMLERRPEAMILTYDAHTERTRRLLAEAGIPVIEIWETPGKPIGHVVGFSNRCAGSEMTRHLIAQGRRRIAFIGESGDAGTRGAERRKGFVDALEASGLDPRRQIAYGPPPIGMQQGREAMQAVLGKWPDTDAVFCVSDPCAFGALTACQLTGRTVPGDLAVAGFGDFEISRCAVPAISTISISGLHIGTGAGGLVSQLLAAHQTSEPAEPRSVLVEATLVARESTGGKPARR